MELLTHNLIAVIIHILCFTYFIFPVSIILTIIFAYLSHLIFDAIAKITYHTPDTHLNDLFWIIWHIFIYTASLISLAIFIVPFWVSILFANIIDIIDWFILRPCRKRALSKNQNLNKKSPLYAHIQADWLREKLFFLAS